MIPLRHLEADLDAISGKIMYYVFSIHFQWNKIDIVWLAVLFEI